MNLENLQAAGQASLYPDRIKITVGLATCGLAAGADVIFDTLKQRLEQRGLDVRLAKTGCLGACHQEPIVEVRMPGSAPILYTKMTRARARALVDDLARGSPSANAWAVIAHDESLFSEPRVEWRRSIGFESAPGYDEQPFFTRQRKIVLRNCGLIDPTSIEEQQRQNSTYTGSFCVCPEIRSLKDCSKMPENKAFALMRLNWAHGP